MGSLLNYIDHGRARRASPHFWANQVSPLHGTIDKSNKKGRGVPRPYKALRRQGYKHYFTALTGRIRKELRRFIQR